MLVAVVFFASSANGAVKKPRIPNCAERPVPALCTVHLNRRLANYFQALMHKPPWPYRYGAERHVASRAYFIWLWTRHRIVSKQRYAAWRAQPWLHGPIHDALMCIHHGPDGNSGEGSWTAYNPSGPYYGGLQADHSFYTTYGAPEVRKYGGRDPRYWSAADQLHMGYRGVQARGYGPWPNTARACGLL